MDPIYFGSSEQWRAWLAEHHDDRREVLVGFHTVASGVASMSWSQSVDEALCFGWIDGVRRRVDGARYVIRFTPRRVNSHWSRVNVTKAQELIASGRMWPSGLAAFEARTPERTGQASFERETPAALDPAAEAAFRADSPAWEWFQRVAPSYRRAALHWVVSAKRAQTRQRRLATLIEYSRQGRRIPPLGG